MSMGKDALLNVSQQGQHRIFVGLGWDPNVPPPLKDKVGSLVGTRSIHHDLDLSCYFFNKDLACLGYVSADSNFSSNESGSIYHSGDNVAGVGDGDDEQVSVELKKLPPNIHSLVFKASIKSGHTFGEVAMPEIRICDGYTERCFAQAALHKGGKHDAFVFVRVYRGPENDGWMLSEITDFRSNLAPKDWKEVLAEYL